MLPKLPISLYKDAHLPRPSLYWPIVYALRFVAAKKPWLRIRKVSKGLPLLQVWSSAWTTISNIPKMLDDTTISVLEFIISKQFSPNNLRI